MRKSETGNPYSKLDNLSDIFGSKKAESNEFPRPLLPILGTHPKRGKPNVLDRVVGSHKLFLVPDEAFTFSALCGRPIRQGTTFCTSQNCNLTKQMKLLKGMVNQGNLYVLRNRNSVFPTSNNLII